MKFFSLLLIIFLMTSLHAEAQIAEPIALPETDAVQNNIESEENALFDLLFIYNIGLQGSTNDGALTGVLFFDDQYWFSKWSSDVIHAVDRDNNFIETFVIPGITGARTFTTDGINIYVATAEDKIYVVDHATKTLTNTIDVTSSATVRMLTYDETLDGGNGGFWIGSYDNGIIASVNMSGEELSLIPLSTHGTRPYDGVVDHYSEGGPYLWVHEFGFTGLRALITQIDIATGTKTGIQYNFETDAPPGNAFRQAGGLFLTDEVDPDGGITFLGVCQCSPSDLLYALKLEEPLAIDEESISSFVIYPNPAKDKISIKTRNSEAKEVYIFNLLGMEVAHLITIENELNIDNLVSGVYLVKIIQGNREITKKLVVE